MAAGVAGLAASPITADQGASASFICLSGAARFALTSCAFAFLAALQLAYSRTRLSFSAVQPSLDPTLIVPRITSRSHSSTARSTQAAHSAHRHVSRQSQARRRGRSPLPRRLTPQPLSPTPPRLTTLNNPLLARSRPRIAPRVPSPVSILRRSAYSTAQTPRHPAAPARPRLRRAPASTHPRRCSSAAAGLAHQQPPQQPRRAAVRRSESALELQF